MPKLIEVDLTVQLPAGATYADIALVFPEGNPYYQGGVVVGGQLVGKTAAANADGLAVVKGLDGVAALKVWGGEVGDDLPPLLGLRITPKGAADGLFRPWTHWGNPRDTGNGKWNGSKFGALAGERLSTEAERIALAQQIANAEAATAELEGKKQEVNVALADIAQDRAGLTEWRDQTQTDLNTAEALRESSVAGLLATMQAIPTAINGLRVQNATNLENGGQGWDFAPDQTAPTISATVSPAPNGGLLYDLTGGN